MKQTLYKTHTAVLLLFTVILVSCNKQHIDSVTKSEVTFTASSNEVTIAGKSFVMDQIFIDLSDIQISGENIQTGMVNLSLTDNSNIDFLNPTSAKILEIPVGTYPELHFSTAVISNGTPSVNITGTYFLSNGGTYDVVIALNIDQEISQQLQDLDGSDVILLEEDNQKNLMVQLDTEILFSDLIPGLWNAAAVTNNNGSQTVQVDELNNANIYNAISGKIGESFVVRFQ